MAGGRPTKYKPEYCKTAEKVCQLGGLDKDVAEAIDVDLATLYRWRHKYPEFCEALTIGKEPCDNRVEAALFHRSIGYSHPDTDIRVIDGQIVQTQITKHYPPDTKAALAWLYNRRPDSWKPTPTEGATEVVGQVIEFIRATKADNGSHAN
jgi:hypothetical protein